MTIFFPDVSRYTPNVDVSKYPVVIAKATMADGTHGNVDETDPSYPGFKAAAAKAGTLFLAYHWLNHGNLQAQARHCFSVVGPGIPVMIDAEDEPGNTGYNGPLTVDDLLGFAAEYRALGGTVSLAYLPFWYWSGAMGAPHRLGELEAAGLHLVSSNYPNAGYTEAGPGWAPYYSGAPSPVQWQYTSTPVDMNAFRGTVAEFAQLVGAEMSDFGPADVNAWTEATRVEAMMTMADKTQPNAANKDGEVVPIVAAIKDIQTKLGALSTSPLADPAAVAAALTPEQLAAAITAAGITPEAVADALAQHFHVS